MNVLITGASGNLGSHLTGYLLERTDFPLTLMVHRRGIVREFRGHSRIKTVRADLGVESTLRPALEGVETIVHFAGVLFKAKPEDFLPTTNVDYFKNLVKAAVAERVRRIILISFPHVEGETTPGHPAVGRLDGRPNSVHAQTRLEEERHLFRMEERHGFQAVSLRVGMVYGQGILMIDTARWLALKWLLGVWTKPTWIHLLSTPDFLAATTGAIAKEDVRGIYHLGDEGRQTLQEFLDTACQQWRVKKPWRMPAWMIYTAAQVCETVSSLFNLPSPLTRDFVTIGRQSYYGDTTRMRSELLPELQYPTLETGKTLLY